MIRWSNSFLFIFGILSSAPTLSAQDIYDYDHSLRFANHLYNIRHYDLAAEEFERVYFLQADEEIAYKLLNSYLLGEKYEELLERGTAIFPRQTMIPGNSAIVITKGYLITGRYTDAGNLIRYNQYINTSDRHLMMMNTLMLSREYDSAGVFLQKHEASFNKTLPSAYRSLILSSHEVKNKKPGLALAMSAVVPGSGRFYTGEWKDGMFSLVMVGVSAWQAYRHFNKNGMDSVFGWISAGFGFAFYIGNLYGSYHSAKNVNLRSRENHYHRVEDLVYSTF